MSLDRRRCAKSAGWRETVKKYSRFSWLSTAGEWTLRGIITRSFLALGVILFGWRLGDYLCRITSVNCMSYTHLLVIA